MNNDFDSANKKRKIINRSLMVLATLLVAFALYYYVFFPFWPAIAYSFRDTSNKELCKYHSKYLAEECGEATATAVETTNSAGETVTVNVEKETNIPKDNRLVIPKIGIDMPINPGECRDDHDIALSTGVCWVNGNGGTIDSGNMVLTGHRLGDFSFLPNEIAQKATFYNLDKLSIGDKIIIFWNGEEYGYVISGEDRVLPTAIEIEAPTKEHRLTLYTCDPVGINSHRIVKYAKPL